MLKFRILLMVSALVTMIFISIASYFAFYYIETYHIFIIFELVVLTFVLIILYIALRLEVIIHNAGYRKLSEDQILFIKDQNNSQFIRSILKKEKLGKDREQIL